MSSQPEFGKCGAEAFSVPAPYLKHFSTETLEEVSRLEKSTGEEPSDHGPSHGEL